MAVEAARSALNGDWKKVTPQERAAMMHKLADKIVENAEELQTIESEDVGKPVP